MGKKKFISDFLFNTVPAITIGWSVLNILHQKSFLMIINSHKQQLRLVFLIIFFYILIKCLKIIYLKIISHYHLRSYWLKEFSDAIDRVFLTFSLFGVVYLTDNRVIEVLTLIAVFIISYIILRTTFKKHPESGVDLILLGDGIFLISLYIFTAAVFFQNFTLKFYPLGHLINTDNLVVYRSMAVVSFWLILFSLSSLVRKKGKKNRHWLVIFWLVAYLVIFVLEIINAGVIYYSGLYINPVVLEHAKGGLSVVASSVNFFAFVFVFFIPIIFLVFLFVIFYNRFLKIKDKYWQAFFYSILVIGVLSFIVFIPLSGNLPEKIIISSFYDYYSNPKEEIKLNDIALKKLEKFGLFYDQNNFIVSEKDKIATSSESLLPKALKNKKPNIIFISLESFSSRLVSSTGGNINNLTPNVDTFSSDINTTVFKNFYNASTPTITGLVAQMCSFLPPTGHQEIEKNNSFNNYLICLPSIIKNNGYKSLAYITAVNKEYVGKSSILKLMGFIDIYGSDEIASYLNENKKSIWGVTDHQQFSFLSRLIKEKTDEPFFLMLSTVDSHQPFTMSKDMIKYGNGDSDLLNSVHSTDDALGLFLDEFKSSSLASNTIIILAADHALFPTSFPEKYFPEISGENLGYYDETVFMMNVPESILPKQIDIYSSSIDIAPTIMDLLGLNSKNYFDGHSIFADRVNYPNILGMHEFGLYINQVDQDKRSKVFSLPQELNCSDEKIFDNPNTPLSICEYLEFFKWKRKMMNDGRLWLRAK